MKLLVSTSEGQGQRSNDFCFVPEGEIVFFGIDCDRDRHDVDGTCGCRRALCGIECKKATTTFKVAEVDITEQGVKDLITKHYVEDWTLDEKDARQGADENFEMIETAVGNHPVGTILERRPRIKPRILEKSEVGA